MTIKSGRMQTASKKCVQRPDGKPGRELALRAEGFFRLDFLVLLCQDKRTSPAAMSGENILLKQKLIILRDEESS